MIIAIVIIVIVLGGALYLVNQNQNSSNSTLTSLDHLVSGSKLQATSTPTPTPPQATPTPAVTPLPTATASESAQALQAKTATIHTEKGDIVIELYPNDAPKTVTNFVVLSQRGYYNGLTFHRVVPGFVIQGGDPNGDGSGGTSIYGPTFDDELNPSTASYKAGYLEGVVAMANRGPNTNGSQFFIMLADNSTLPHAYTIFGKVSSGMDVVQKIVKGDKMDSITIQ